MNKMLWLRVSLISMISLHGMYASDDNDATSLRVSMACGFATGASIVGGLGSMAVDHYYTGEQHNKRSWDDNDSKIEGLSGGLSVACALGAIMISTLASDKEIHEFFPSNNISNAFLAGLTAGAIAGGSALVIKTNKMKYEAPKWESLSDWAEKIEKQHNLPHREFSARITQEDSDYIKHLGSL